MVTASRSRVALSPVHQNQLDDPSAASNDVKLLGVQPHNLTADRTGRSVLRARLAHGSSARSGSPLLSNQLSCFVELPLVVPPPVAMQSAQIRAGLKRKKGARNQLGVSANTGKHSDRSSGSLDRQDGRHPGGPSLPSGLSRTGSLRSRSRNNKPVDIIASPHIPRERASSSASELSDWSSVLSVSPTTSRAPTSRTEETKAALQPRPAIQTRRSSRNSLYRTLDGMSLEDSFPVGLGFQKLSRSHSQSMSRQSSNHDSGNADEPSSRTRSHRSASSVFVPDSDHSSNASVEMDDEDAENARLVSSAPTWQLHRLRKDDLIQLCHTAGAWDTSPNEAELELLTKQDLVNQIITCRSRLDRSLSGHRQASGPSRRQQRAASGSHDTYYRRAQDVFDQDADQNGNLFTSSSLGRNPSNRLGRRSNRASASNSAEDDHDASLSDASNEAGGEETEAEPQLANRARRGSNKALQAHVVKRGALRRMDSSTFDELEPTKQNQAPRRQLRDKTSLRGAIGRRLRLANGSEAMSASTSSSIFGGRSSRASIHPSRPSSNGISIMSLLPRRRYEHDLVPRVSL